MVLFYNLTALMKQNRAVLARRGVDQPPVCAAATQGCRPELSCVLLVRKSPFLPLFFRHDYFDP